jgi:hypothetical protein
VRNSSEAEVFVSPRFMIVLAVLESHPVLASLTYANHRAAKRDRDRMRQPGRTALSFSRLRQMARRLAERRAVKQRVGAGDRTMSDETFQWFRIAEVNADGTETISPMKYCLRVHPEQNPTVCPRRTSAP